MTARLAITAVLCSTLCGCGVLDFGDNPGGDSNLPVSGGGPYRKLLADRTTPADEPFVFQDAFFSFSDPTVLPRSGGGFRVWMTRSSVTATEIVAGELTAVTALPVGLPMPVLVADAAWEQGRVAAPSVVEVAGGALLLYYEGGDPVAPSIGLARSNDGGASWTKEPGNPILAGVASPGAVVIDEVVTLYVEQAGSIARVDLGADGTPIGAPSPAIAPDAINPAFPEMRLADPAPLARRTAAGRTTHLLFFSVETFPTAELPVPDRVIGSAGSFDGVSWQRFLDGAPILSDGSPPEDGPAVIFDGTTALLFYSEESAGRRRVGVAFGGDPP